MTIRHAFESAVADGVSGTAVKPSHWNADHIVEGFGGEELDYVQITSNVATTQTAEASAQTVITGNPITVDGSETILVHFFADSAQPQPTSGVNFIAYLFDGSSSIGLISRITNNGAAGRWPMDGWRRLTPSAGSHTYSIRTTTGSGTGTILAGAGGSGTEAPAFLRITKVVAATGEASGAAAGRQVVAYPLLGASDGGTSVTPSANDAYFSHLNLAGPMRVTGVEFDIATSNSGTIEWGLFDGSTAPTAATKVAGGSGTTGGTSWRTIAATGSPVDVPAGAYILIWKAPSSGIPAFKYSALGSQAVAWAKQASYTWDDTPDLTTGWAASAGPITLRLIGTWS